MNADQINTRACTHAELRNTDSDMSSKYDDDSTEILPANRNTFIEVDGVRYATEDFTNCVRILDNTCAWLDDYCMQMRMLHLKKKMKEHQNDSLEIIFASP